MVAPNIVSELYHEAKRAFANQLKGLNVERIAPAALALIGREIINDREAICASFSCLGIKMIPGNPSGLIVQRFSHGIHFSNLIKSKII